MRGSGEWAERAALGPPSQGQTELLPSKGSTSLCAAAQCGGASGLTAENEGTKEDGSLLNYQLPALLPTLPPER